jgi:hypothetical protein
MQRAKEPAHSQLGTPEVDHLPCSVHLVTAPATPGQRQAWSCLWRLLLAEEEPPRGTAPKNVEAPGAAIPEASKTCGLDGMDQAACRPPTTPPRGRRRHR